MTRWSRCFLSYFSLEQLVFPSHVIFYLRKFYIFHRIINKKDSNIERIVKNDLENFGLNRCLNYRDCLCRFYLKTLSSNVDRLNNPFNAIILTRILFRAFAHFLSSNNYIIYILTLTSNLLHSLYLTKKCGSSNSC